MKKNMIATVLLILLTVFFAVRSHATIQKCDVSLTRGGGIDGRDLAQFIEYYAANDSRADVDESPGVDSADVAHFAGFFGSSYRLPNILLIIADDVGLDMTTDMYDGLIAGLLAQYGPDGLNHANYSTINHGVENGRPASLASASLASSWS